MGFLRSAAAALLCVSVIAGASRAAGFQNTDLGAVARGMGGAFRSLADDWTAAYYNPAGYAFMLDNEVGSAVHLPHLRHDLRPNYGYRDQFGNRYEMGVYNDRTVNNVHNILNNHAAGITLRLPVLQETVFGLSGYQPFDYQINWNLFSPLESYTTDTFTTIPRDQFLNDIDVVAFQLTAAREVIPERMSIGIGLQLLRADLQFHDLVFRPNPLGSPVSDRPRDFVPQFARNDGNGWGFGLNAGMLYKVTPKLNIGATIALPFDITISGDAHSIYILPENDFLSQQYQPTDPRYLFTSGGNFNVLSTFETKLKLPASLGAGVSYAATERLTVALDAEYVFWNRFDGFAFDYDDFSHVRGPADSIPTFFEKDISAATDWDNTGKIALGLRYRALDFLNLLGGVAFEQAVVRNGVFRPQFVDTGDKTNYNLGAVFTIAQRLNVGTTIGYIQFPDETTSTFTDLNGDGLPDSFPGRYRADHIEFVLSGAVKF